MSPSISNALLSPALPRPQAARTIADPNAALATAASIRRDLLVPGRPADDPHQLPPADSPDLPADSHQFSPADPETATPPLAAQYKRWGILAVAVVQEANPDLRLVTPARPRRTRRRIALIAAAFLLPLAIAGACAWLVWMR